MDRLQELSGEPLLRSSLVESAPVNVKEGIAKAEADGVVAKLKEAGATAELA